MRVQLLILSWLLLLTVASCGAPADPTPAPVETAHSRSALMLGGGPVTRLDEFVRVGGGLYWRFTGTFEHDYQYVDNFGTNLTSDPAVVSWGTGRVDVFVINEKGTIDHGGIDGDNTFRWWDNWGSPAPGRALSGISAISGRYGLLDLFVVDTAPFIGTNNLYHRRWDNGNDTGWVLLSGAGANGGPSYFGGPGAIAGGSNGVESFDVFVKGGNPSTGRPNIFHLSSSNGGFTVLPWENLGEPGGAMLASDPRGASWSDGRMDVIVADTTGAIRHLYTGGCNRPTFTSCQGYRWFWNGWAAPPVASAPNIVAKGPNRLSVLARQASDNSLIECVWDNQDLGCQNHFGVFTGGPGVSAQGADYCDGQQICFVPQLQKIYDTAGTYQLTAQDVWNIAPQINDSFRRKVVQVALQQVLPSLGDGATGACGDYARKVYGAPNFLWWKNPWCTEFARSVLLWSGAPNVGDLWDASEVSDMKNVFQPWGDWITRSMFSPTSLWSSPQPGDYMTIVNREGDHFGHSSLIVGVSADNQHLFTVEGNVDDCVKFNHRPYMVGGNLAGNIDAFGKADVFE